VNLKFIELVRTTVQKTVELEGGKEGKVQEEVVEEVEVGFESHPAELLISAVSRYARQHRKKIPQDNTAWNIRSKATGKSLSHLRTLKELGSDIEKGIFLEAA
jgi:hypothetical protein